MEKITGFLKTHFHFVAIFLFSAIGILIYSNTFQTTFQFDDYFAIVNNTTIRKLEIPVIWDAFRTRFILGLSLAFNYYWSQLNTYSYHIFNLTIHILTTTSIYFLANYLFQTPYFKKKALPVSCKVLSLFAALLFLVHPIETQAVSYIWQRGAAMTALFYISAVMFYLKARVESSKIAYILSLMSIILGMFTKENSATVPAAIFTCEFFFFGPWKEQFKKRILRLVPVLLCLLVIPLSMTQANEVQLDLLRSPLHFTDKSEDLSLLEKISMITRWANPQDMPRKDYLLTQLNVVRAYVRLLFLPINQNLDYDFPITKTFFNLNTLFSTFVLIFIWIGAFFVFRRSRLLLFCVIWFYLNLFIESFVPMQDVIFEHRVYLPSVGFVLAVPYYLFALLKRQRVVVSLFCVLIVTFSVMTYQRNKVWKSELTLWHDVVKKSPNKARPHVELGAAYGRIGNIDEVIRLNLRAIELDPYRALAYGNAGYGFYQKGELNKALKYYHASFKYQDYLPWIANNMSVAYRKTGRLDQAVYWSEKAVEQNPLLPSSYSNLGYHYFLKGEFERGIQVCQKGVELDPDHAPGYVTLGIMYFKLNQIERAENYFQQAIQLSPSPQHIYNNWGALYMEKRDWKKAKQLLEQTLKMDPRHADAHFNIGVLSLQLGELDLTKEKLEALKQINRLDLYQRLEQIASQVR